MVDNSHNNGKISRRAIFLFPTDNLVYNDHCLLTVREQLEDSKKATFHICCARTIFQRHFLSVQAIQRPCRTFCPAYFTFIFDSINYSLRAVSTRALHTEGLDRRVHPVKAGVRACRDYTQAKFVSGVFRFNSENGRSHVITTSDL